MRTLRPAPVACALVALAAGCSSAVGSSRLEDKARRDVPIAICRMALGPSDTVESGAPRAEAYVRVLIPSFQGFSAPLPPGAKSCVGEPVLSGEGVTPGAPIAVTPAQMSVGLGEDGLRVVWLRLAAEERVSSGLLALARPRPTELDVYAVGQHRGSTRHTRFAFGRMGMQVALFVYDDGCADAGPGVECESMASVYPASGGALVPAAKLVTEKVQFGAMRDVGRVKWRLTTEPPLLDATSLRVKEKLTARDARDDEVRKLEGVRVYTLRGGELVPTGPSIWAQLDRGGS